MSQKCFLCWNQKRFKKSLSLPLLHIYVHHSEKWERLASFKQIFTWTEVALKDSKFLVSAGSDEQRLIYREPLVSLCGSVQVQNWSYHKKLDAYLNLKYDSICRDAPMIFFFFNRDTDKSRLCSSAFTAQCIMYALVVCMEQTNCITRACKPDLTYATLIWFHIA